ILLGVLLVYTQPQKDLIPLLQDKYMENGNGEKTDKEIIAESLKETIVEDLKQTVTQRPNYLGEDVNKKLWSLKATKAIQSGEMADGFTDLFNVVANTLSVKDSKVDYIADKGRFISAENKVILKDNVIIKSESLILKTDNLEYDLVDAYAESPTPVDIKADFGNIIADSMKSFDNADRLVLTGNVRAKLYDTKK
ncbi:MAG TPA: LPS export ABC transporter periplasmic protein LptC, partial [Alphaproteobacteria bacterium]|nr:LPS export ABC transporter periplasmic protein LptC [Alphaproteobacteria bacterium]